MGTLLCSGRDQPMFDGFDTTNTAERYDIRGARGILILAVYGWVYGSERTGSAESAGG
jgi:hypothetical protein